ncbi:RWP-RK domain [Dillenia turbinata]|uniref:RWP-RK domain n=1 Tax=Dillenia turbinata TaxID=194707 RepID=A0AAN8Z6S6_9MAGN
MCEGSKDGTRHAKRTLPVFDQDLNCLPYPVSSSEQPQNEQNDQSESGKVVKKKRAPSELVANLALEDLANYFDMPIVEASKNLQVELTVLKRKCKKFGIPRWPHRKIKSLGTLIHDLQEEAERQQQEDKVAAMAVAKRQRTLVNERESIERKPFIELKNETKRFRQDVFKRRHRARALQNQVNSAFSSEEEE